MSDQMNKMGGKHPGTMPVKKHSESGDGKGGSAKSPKYRGSNVPGKSGEKAS